MKTDERTAAEAMYRALALLPCACRGNVPYAGCPTDRIITHKCCRCKDMQMWELSRLEEAA